MIVCHCNVIACSEIRKAVRELGGEAGGLVTPGQIFKCCGRRPQCGGCMSHVSSLIVSELDRMKP
ncbi:bacterioferritin-associated ferredoxin [Aestuariivirga sp.]|uniref:(2Fe-2S)-binding protein n=1 Tax=Aestuariivirga sp. TaxID=2650926 RepID=UPI00391C86F9